MLLPYWLPRKPDRLRETIRNLYEPPKPKRPAPRRARWYDQAMVHSLTNREIRKS